MVSIRPLSWIFVFTMMISVFCQTVGAQTATDTLTLSLVPVDSVVLTRDYNTAVIRWYPPHDSVSSRIGSIDLSNWIAEYDPILVSEFGVEGFYTGMIDRSLRFEREIAGSAGPLVVGVDPYISLRVETTDPVNRTYSKTINIGSNYYTPEDRIPLMLVNEEPPRDTLDLGFDIWFGEGIVDSTLTGGGAIIDMDLQDFEGYHVWRGLTPFPADMNVISEISKEDYFMLSDRTSVNDVPQKWVWLWEYFRDDGDPAFPRTDEYGNKYYEWVDDNVYPGFLYYYHVTCYDQGYIKGTSDYYKVDNFICDEDPDDPLDPENIVECGSVAFSIDMSVDCGGDTDKEMMDVYAVPNPFRTGSSADTSPSYHNYHGEPRIKFFNLPQSCEIRVFNVAGDLVWQHTHFNEDGTDGIATWDVKNQNGNEVASGVYVFRCESSSGGSVYGRIVVIR